MNEIEVKKLYNALIQKGYTIDQIGNENTFLNNMNDENKRRDLYEYVSSKGNFKIGDYDTYESRLTSSIEQSTDTIAQSSNPVEDVKQDSLSINADEDTDVKVQSSQRTMKPETTEDLITRIQRNGKKDKQEELLEALSKRQEQKTAQDRYVKGIEDSIEKKANELIEEDVNLSTFNKTKDNGLQFNPSTGKLERSYSTPNGNTTTDRHLADMESSQYASNMTVSGQLRQAQRKLDELKRMKQERASEVHDETADFIDSKLTGFGQALIGGNFYVSKQMSDPEKNTLDAAILETEEQIKILEREIDRQNNKRVGFWRGFTDITGDINTWDFGLGDAKHALTLLDVGKDYPHKSDGTKQAEQELLESVYKKQQAQQSYGQNDNFWFRAGTMTGHMPAFMIDFAVTGGGFDGINALSKAATKGATKAIGKEVIEEMAKQGFKNYVKANGVKGFSQYAGNWTIKALGTMADDLIIRAPLMTNTVQAAKTASDIIDRKLGSVVVNEDGTYDFSNDKTWSNAIWQGEANAIIENYSEMFGAHLAPVTLKNMSDVAAVFGAKRLSGVLAKADASAIGTIMGKTNEMFTKLGVSDYFGEVTEEYYGQLWRTMLNLDDAYRQNPDGSRTNLLTTGQFHGDILGGMALSMGLMGAGKYSLSAANYTMMKHDVNKADSRARELFGNDIWEPLRQTIDLTTNDDIGNYIGSVLIDDKLTLEEKEAVLNYVERSLYLRGFNLATLAQSRNTDESDSDIIDQQNNESFLDGYNASTPQEMNDAKNMLEVKKAEMIRTFGLTDESDIEAFLGENPIETVARRRQNGESEESTQTIIDYLNAKATYVGMIHRVHDDIDGQIEQSNALIDSHTNKHTGKIHGAVSKEDGRLVYIVSGNVVPYQDGSGIDLQNSDENIIIRDAETGELKQMSPEFLSSLYDTQDPNEQKEINAQQIREKILSEESNKIDGVVDFNDKEQFLNEVANKIAITIILAQRGLDADYIKTFLGNAQIVENPDGTLTFTDGQNEVVVPKQEIQQQVDANNMQRAVDFNDKAKEMRNAIQQATAATATLSYGMGDNVSLRDTDGNIINGTISMIEDDTYVIDYSDNNGTWHTLDLTKQQLDDMAVERNETGVNDEPVTELSPVDMNNDNTITEQSTTDEGDLTLQSTIDENIPTTQTVTPSIPKDESGNPIYEQADSETAWDALMEDAEGDEIMAGEVAKSMIADKEAELKKLEKSKIKEGKTPAEKMAALKERKAEVEKIKQDIEAWKKIAAVPIHRQIAQQERIRQEEAEAAAKRKADEERLLAERKEAERKEQELLNGIPDYSEDTPQNARARGYRRVNGHIEERQQPIETIQGKETEIEFSNDARPKGHYAVIDASQLQPSHIQGNRNPLHFLDEAQPKERNDKASIVSAQKIAGNIRPATITTGETAYVGTPTVNTRGEVIQGNSRSDALKLMYGNHNDQAQTYKQYLIDNAEQFGLNPEDVSNMESPVLVRMLDINDEQAITLGQYVAQDTESGGIERIKPKNAVKKMGEDIGSFANILLKSNDEDVSFAELLDQNGVEVLKWMAQKSYITPTQYNSQFDTKGSLTAEAKNDLRGIMYQSIFEGGNTRLEEMFNALPAKAQKAILATAHRDFNSPNSERMIEEIQNSIRAFYALMQDEQFAKAKNFKEATKAVEAWQKQYQMDDVTGESYLPSEKFTNFALHLALLYKSEKQSNIQGVFSELYDLIQGTKEGNLFEQADNTPRTLVQAIKEVLNIDYNGQRRNNVLVGDNKTSQQGQHGRTGDVASEKRTESREQSADNSGRTDEDSGSPTFETNRQTENESGDIRTAQTVHQSGSEREGFEQTLDGRRQTDGSGMADDNATVMEKRTSRSDIRVLEEGLDAKRGDNTEHSERTRRTAESERLVNTAKQHGLFIPAEVIMTLTGKYPKRTGESVVYIDTEAGKVTKVKDPYAKSAMKSGVQPEDAIFEHRVHNLLFPETAYTLEGISEELGDVRIVLTQDYIQTKGHPTKEQITEALAKRGLFPEDKYSFGNEFVSVTDVEGDNVLLGEDGTVYFIDPIIRFKKPLKEILDNYNRNNNSTLGEQIKSAEKEVNTSPTDKQKEAGNYKKGHVQIGTFNITIEQPKGSVRSGVDANGRKWETTMHNTYGYIRGTEGVDGDHIDVFLSDDIDSWNGNNVFVVDQYNEDGTFDEHKVMLGFNTIEEAESAYLDNYEKGWEKKHKIVVSPIHTDNFEKWIVSSHRKTKPFAEYKSVKSEENRTKNNENRTKSTENDSKVEESSVKDESKNKTIVEQSKKPSSKIEDFGEKIGGARKDVIRKYADKINVNGTTFGSMFPKPDIDKLIEAGLPIDRVAALKAVYDNAKHEFERSKKHRGKERALRETVFYAVFAKGILSGNEDFELHHEGLVFTEVGVKLVKANIALYQAVFDRLGVEYIKTDLSAYAITPLTEETKKKLNLKSLNEHNGKMQESLAKRKGTEPPVYKDGDLINFIGEKYYNPKDQFETLEEAIDTMVERIGKEVKVGEEIKHTPILYWNVDALGRKDYSKIFIGIKVHGHGIVKLMEFKSSNEANSWIDEHDADFQQMAAAKIEQLKSDKSKPLPKYRIDNIYVRDNNGSIVRYDVYADFGKGIMRPLKSFDIPAKETSQERLRAQSEVYKNEVLPYMNSEEAKQSADEHAKRIQQEKESKNRNYTTERKSRERVGRDWRNGKDATPDMFVDMDGKKSVFGFRAVEFGNYVTNKERQQFLNDIYDALMDMSDVLGVSPRALSLGGQLAIAVGARGKSSASGHYEPEKNVINLTKTSGYGILAHEWLHAFDRYFSNYNPSAIYVGGVQYATSEEYKDDMRQEVKDAFAALMDVIKKSDYYKRSMMLGEYWSSDKELAARALQDHIIRKLNERGQKNEFLSNLTATEDWDGEAENYPFPLGEESERIGEAIDNLFSVIEEKVDEKGNTVMYQKGKLVMDAESEAFRRATERTMKQLESIGIDVEIVEDVAIIEKFENRAIRPNFSRSAGIFYSNAKKAVLDIKQDKATPEQWLKMIEKNGGLKASEDRWLGLSDWLKTQQKRKNIDVQYAKEYDGEAKQIAHGIKEGDISSIDLAAVEMVKLVKDGDILIPIPSRTGKATTSLALANRIAELAGKGKVADVLTGKERESLYNIKKEGKELPKASELEFVLKNQEVLNGNNRVVFVDNVMGTGTTLEAAVELIPNATALVYAKDNSTLSDKKTLTKDEILNFINENSIQIEEVEYEENPSSFDELKDEYERLLREEGYDYAQEVMRDRYGDDFDIAFADMGGELVIDNEEAAATLLGSNNIINSTRLQYTTEGLDNKKEIALVVPTIESYNSHDAVHFGDAGGGRAVAWIRFGETTDKDGKRVLVIDEIQSKRHQDGREKGYRDDKTLTARLDALKESAAKAGMTFNADVRNRSLQFLDLEGKPIGTMTRKPTDEQSEIMAQVRNVLFYNDGVPSAPFEKNWQELAMKRMLRYAAENGFDKVAWTTGEQQAERYSLSKAVKKTTVSVMSDNTRMVTLDFRHDEGYMDFKQMRVDEKGTIIGGDFTGSQLSDIVGKEFAIKIMGVEAERETFTDNDLRIGGEGMKGFYDKILPSFVSKYTKKWGGKVEETELPETGLSMHSVDVTPQMKEDVMKGQPMFHKGQMSFDFLNQQDTPLSDTRLRKLEEGETSKIERIFTENKNFDFTSGEKIESIDDVAFIFKQLEDESIENSFAVLVKDGKPTVIHLGMGSYTATGLNGSALNVAVERIQPDKIYFIHNHPSGNLTASRQDIELLNRLKSTYGDIFEDGIIINLRSGKFATFNAEEKNIHDEKNIDNAVPVKVYSFNKQVFEKNYDPAETFKIRSSSDVAKFISSHRLGERPKLGILVCNNQLGVVGNVFTPYTKVTKENAKDIAKDIVYYTTSMGGTCAMMFGNANIYEVGSKRISQHVEDISTGSIKLMDYLNMQKDGSYWSASDEGVSFMRTSSGTIYGWTVDGKVYLTKDGINPNTPVHEYSHLWAEALMKNNPVLWSRIVNGLKDTPVWNEMMLDEEYSSIHHNDNLVASEVLSRLSGTENYRRTMEEAQREIESEKGIFAKAEKITIWERVKQALKDFWNWVVKTYGTNNITPEEAVNMTLKDFWNGVKPKGARSIEAASDIANAEEDDEVLYRSDNEDSLNKNKVNYPAQRRQMVEHAENLAKRLHLDNIEIVNSVSGLEGKKKSAKGFYDPKTGKITIVIPNNTSIADIEKTLLHEAVAHYGLRQLFGEHFDTFLDNVYNNADESIRKRIAELAIRKYNYDFRKATEEYLASLAESTNFENAQQSSWWQKVKDFFADMLSKLGFRDFRGVTLTDNELRYILWRSYENLSSKRHKGVFGQAADIAKQYELGVGDYAKSSENEDDVLFRDGDNTYQDKATVRKIYEDRMNNGLYQSKEAMLDSMKSLEEAMLMIDGKNKHVEDIADYENAYLGENRLSSVNSDEITVFEKKFIRPMLKVAAKLAKNMQEYIELLNYMMAKHGLERNVRMADDKAKKEIIKRIDILKNEIFKESKRIEKSNELYNKKLEEFRNKTVKGDIKLGKPGPILESCGINASDIFITPKTLSEHLNKHGLTTKDIADLPKALEDPMLVYEWGTKAKSLVVITQIERGNQRITVAIKLERGGKRLEINEIASVHGKEAEYFIEEMSNAKEGGLKDALKYANKENALDWLGLVPPEGTASLNKQGLSIANVIQNFENPITRIQKIQQRIDITNSMYRGVKNSLSTEEAKRWYNTRKQTIDSLLKNEKITQEQYDKRLQKIETIYNTGMVGIERNRDFAGLTALTGKKNVADAEAEAQRMVDEYEQNHDTTELWDNVNAVSKAILQKSYDSGLMNKETFDRISSMYKFYIPLRGFDEKTSAEAYAYLTHKESAFNAPIKQACGRTSKADNPLVYLQSMAESTIMQGNRNRLVKQRFLNFVLNHPSDLVSVSELWLEYDNVDDEWRPVFPDNIDTNDSGEVVEQKMKDFEEKMESLAKQHPDKYKKSSDAKDIPYRVVTSKDLHEHQIVVKRNGRDVILTVNGNPRLAHAINGLSNPDNNVKGTLHYALEMVGSVNRFKSALYTTWSVGFMAGNFMRDCIYSNSMVWVKEDLKGKNKYYALKYNYNYLNLFGRMKRLLRKYNKGTLDMSNPTHKHFHDFMRNGGETGYRQMNDIGVLREKTEQFIKAVNALGALNGKGRDLAEWIGEVGRGIENHARFAAFMTSRDMGRDMGRSIYDAKDISVNFNKKGSGDKYLGETGQTPLGNVSAATSFLGRTFFYFWNAALQGTFGNFFKHAARHPYKALTVSSIWFTLGLLVTALAAGDDDDDDESANYFNNSEHTRRSNVMIKSGKNFLKVPLPIEYRAIYGLGELCGSTIFNGEELTVHKVLSLTSQLLPVDFMAGQVEGDFNLIQAFVPSSMKTHFELKNNRSWNGIPIYKDTPFNQDKPDYTKAYSNANKQIVNITKNLNEKTGGDAHTKGIIDMNPAKAEYWLQANLGGIWTLADQLIKTGEWALGKRDFRWNYIPVAERFVTTPDERTAYRYVNNEYFRLKKEHDQLHTRIKAYEKDTYNGIFDYAEKIDFLYNSPEYKRYEIYEKYKDVIKIADELVKQAAAENDEEALKEAQMYLNEARKSMVMEVKDKIQEMNKTRQTRKRA